MIDAIRTFFAKMYAYQCPKCHKAFEEASGGSTASCPECGATCFPIGPTS